MAITKIAGELLESNLIRTTDLAFNTDLLVLDVDTGRIGIGQSPGNFKLDILGNTRITGNQTITGDLTVQGTTTSIDSQNLTVEDNILEINTNASADTDSGIMINRGGANNPAVFYWDETDDVFKFGTTTSDGSTRTDLTSVTLANIQVAEPTSSSDVATKNFVDSNISSNISAIEGGTVTLGLPTDSSFGDGAYPLDNSGTITDAVDDLNEVTENIRLSQYVKSVTFTADTTAAGSGAIITLTISAVGGGADRYTITWGDGGSNTTGTSDSTPSHTYTATGTMSVTVKAYNNSAITDSSGSHASVTRTNYITIYTATPVVDLELYDVSSGGSALTGNNLWVVEGQTRYMKNLTTNTLAGAATVGYDMNWGYGSDETIGDGAVAGGSQEDSGTYLAHSWGAGTNTGTGNDTLTLELDVHSTANPADIPATDTLTLKVYDDFPAAPNNVSSKTIAMDTSDSDYITANNMSPKLCSGFDDRTSGATYVAGNSVNRVTTNIDPVRTLSQSTFCYNAAAGVLTAYVNGSADGAITFGAGDQSGTASSITVESESDYNLLDATGAATSFATSIYYPTHFIGFKAIASKLHASTINKGVNSFQLGHTSPSAVTTNVLEWVHDDVTATPTTTIGAVTQGTAGSFRYISGVPYYNTGSPTVTVTGTTITNVTGQTYPNGSPHDVSGATTSEGSGNVLTSNPTSFTYANIDGASTMLSSGVPVKDTGVSGAYTIGAVTCPLNTSVASVQTIQALTKNSNGSGGNSEQTNTKIQVYSSSLSGLDDEAGGITVSDSLGATFDDDALRITSFSASTVYNPATSATNYYTGAAWSGEETVAGTTEAISRFGTIGHNVIDYSSGYLPAGPDLNTGRSGTQWYTFAFRRTLVNTFTVTISGRISGFWIAAPGSQLDTTASPTNGWLDAGFRFAGAGYPGTGVGGNSDVGIADTDDDRICPAGAQTTYSGASKTLNIGSANLTNSTGNNCLVRIKLVSGDSITALSIA